MNDPLNRAALAKLERFLLMAKSAKGAGAAKLIQDAISAPDVFVFAELLHMPNISELAQNEQQKQWLEVLRLFSHGTYNDYKANASRLPSLTPVQITKLKYLTLASMAKSARILTYSSLQEGLDIASIRELEDLIIEAMYQDVIHGKLDQLRQIFEIEWAMGRDLRQGEEKELLDALKNWSKTTGQVLKALDQQIKSIKEKERAHTKMLEDQEKEFQANLQEAAIKAKEQPASSSQGHARQARRPLGPAGQGSRGDDMDIDEIVERGGMGGAFDMLRGKKKDSGSRAPVPPKRRKD